jgi:peroxiredoxin
LYLKTIVLSVSLLMVTSFSADADQAGDKASSFRLSTTTGSSVALDDFAGKVILLNFWATWCVSCREELIELDRLYRQYRDRGFTVIGISVDASSERVAAFLKKQPVGFPVVTDTNGAVAAAYRFSGLPAGFLIGRDGVIVRTYRGSGKELISLYEKDIEDLLKRK